MSHSSARYAAPLSLCHAGAFDGVGSSTCITATPAVVHFGGFQPGSVHSQIVRLINTSSTAAIRAHVVPPESPFFKVRVLEGD